MHFAHLLPIAKAVGSSRIARTLGIPIPFGDPQVSSEDEFKERYQLVENGIHLLEEEIADQKVIDE